MRAFASSPVSCPHRPLVSKCLNLLPLASDAHPADLLGSDLIEPDVDEFFSRVLAQNLLTRCDDGARIE